MSILQRCFQWYFAIASILSGFMMVAALMQARMPRYDWRVVTFNVVVCALMAGVTFISAFASWMLWRGARNANNWALMASVVNLVFIPIGTVAGAIGMFVFIRAERRGLRIAERVPAYQPVAGDGTWRYANVFAIVLCLVICHLLFPWLDSWALRVGLNQKIDFTEIIYTSVMAGFLSTVFHELGHAAGAWIAGFSVCGVSVGPFSWMKLDGRSRFRFDLKRAASGSVETLARTGVGMKSGYAVVVAAGPAGSLFFAMLTLLLLVTAHGHLWAGGWRLLEFLTVVGAISALGNLVPTGTGKGTFTDGAQLRQLAMNGVWARYIEFGLYRELASTTMLSPAEWPSDQVEEAVSLVTVPDKMLLERLLAYTHYRQKGEMTQAATHMEDLIRLAEKRKPGADDVYAAEIAFYNAFYADRAEDARIWLGRAKDRSTHEYHRAAAAVMGLEGSRASGLAAWERGWAMVQRAPACGNRAMDEQDFDAVAARWYPEKVRAAELASA